MSGSLHLCRQRHTRRSDILRALVGQSIPTAGAEKHRFVLRTDAFLERCPKPPACLLERENNRKQSFTATRAQAELMNVGCRIRVGICGRTTNSRCLGSDSLQFSVCRVDGIAPPVCRIGLRNIKFLNTSGERVSLLVEKEAFSVSAREL